MRETPAWRGEPLPRGRHKLTPEAVRASQRERLVRAMVESVAERGYAATTVPEVVAMARVSRNAFYDHFADKTDCFIAACVELGAEMVDLMLERVSEPDWISAVRRGTRDYLEWWEERPAFARAYFLELPAAGARGIAQRELAYERFRTMFRALGEWARREQPELEELSPLVPRLLTAGVTELVAEEVHGGRGHRLTALEDELVELVVRLIGGDAAGARAAS